MSEFPLIGQKAHVLHNSQVKTGVIKETIADTLMIAIDVENGRLYLPTLQLEELGEGEWIESGQKERILRELKK
jgi:hypothetical protein